jgi:hypothetical protein
LRKGDELQAFHAEFRDMYQALRSRILKDNVVLDRAIAAIEGQASRTPELEQSLVEMRTLLAEKTQSLSPPAS